MFKKRVKERVVRYDHYLLVGIKGKGELLFNVGVTYNSNDINDDEWNSMYDTLSMISQDYFFHKGRNQIFTKSEIEYVKRDINSYLVE